MNKAELAAAVAEQVHGTESDARAHVDALFDVIMRSVAAGERVQVVGFGTFDGAQRAARVGRNPRTGAAIQVAASVTPRFQAGQTFRARVNGASSSAATPVAAEVDEPAPVVTKKDVAKKDVAKKAKATNAKAKKAKTAPDKKPAKSTKPAKTAKTAKSTKPTKSVASTTPVAKTAKSSKSSKPGKSSKSGKK